LNWDPIPEGDGSVVGGEFPLTPGSRCCGRVLCFLGMCSELGSNWRDSKMVQAPVSGSVTVMMTSAMNLPSQVNMVSSTAAAVLTSE